MFSFRSIVFSSLPAHEFIEIAAELLGVDHHKLRVRHLWDTVDAGLRKIVLDEADIAPAVLLLLVAVPVGDLRADLCIFKVKGWRGFLFGVGWNRSGCEYSGNCGIYCFVQLNTIYRAGSHSVYYALSGDHPTNRGGILVAEKEIIWIIMIASEEDR